MSHTHPRTLTFADLDGLRAEVLPGRLLLSALAPLGGGAAGGGGGDTTIVYACQATNSPGNNGLLGTGLFAQAPYSSLTCVPGTVVQQHG
ncbi:hypothetical protein ACFOY4_13320 [Actinomadura syzygii]|uniref:Uncharacterized protein n=1 Tax=Actinomadura syzygii TaxID=1427538 RepID=A0A5D0U5I7_9ACTN|nr:hypothetical protein [Actinomadura syzygii]TYC13901.1 hypothetical protein FXF65_19855 [Actinomadura syzygii]